MFRKLTPFLSPFLVFLCALYPNIAYYSTQDAGISYLLTSILYALPLWALLCFIRNKWLYYVAIVIVTICTLLEFTMVMLFENYVLSGNILAILNTDSTEGSEFIKANYYVCWHWISIIALALLAGFSYNKDALSNMKIKILFFLFSLIAPSFFVFYKLNGVYKGENELTYNYFIPTRVLNRPPYNFPYQIYNIVKIQQVKKCIEEAKNFSFNATKTVSAKREIHVLAVGESMRHENLSLNGYKRKTTPRLDSMSNIISFDNYYSAACLTMFSVPQIVSRATPQTYDLNYKERGIVQAFKEVGFKTYVVVSGGNLLSYEHYLTNSADSLIILPNKMQGEEEVSGDKDIVSIIDSLVNSNNDDLFLLLQFKGNHHPYTNFEEEFDVWRPNFKSATAVERINNDSLYINAYDNSMLYQDWILSDIINKINKSDVVTSFTLVSDHGENITATGGGHGGDCSPIRTEYHVPFVFWCSDELKKSYPQKIENANKREKSRLNSDNIFYSVCDIAGIELDSTLSNKDFSVFSDDFVEHDRYILLPDGVNYIKVD